MAGTKIRGITIELSADASGINKALQSVNKSISSTSKELKDIDKLLKLDPTNVTLLAQKHETLQRQITNTKEKLDQLRKAEEDLKKQMVNGGTEEQQKQLAALQREIISTERDLDKYEKQLNETEQETKELGKETGNLVKEEQNAGNATDQLNGGFTVLKGTLSNLIAQGIQKAASAVKNFAGDMINVAAEVKAANSQFEQTFGDLADEASAAIDRVSNTTGVLSTRLRGSATQIYAFARASGADTAEAMALMETALMAAADSAAYYDKSLEDSTETLQSFLKGNFANDAALGVSATEFTRNAKATELFGKKYAELTEIQKQQTLLRMVTDSQKLSGAMGQAAREAEGWENVQGNLNETWKQFKANVGTPFLEALIPVIQRVTQKMQAWMNSVDWQKYGEKVKNALDKLVDGLEWVLKNGDKVKAILTGIVSAMAVNKITTFVSGIMSMVTALGKAKVAQEGLNAAANSNPYILLASVLIGLVTAMASYGRSLDEAARAADESWQATDKMTEAAKEQIDAVNACVESYNSMAAAREASLSAGMSELAHVQSLTDELGSLADESGRVSDEDRARAEFILGELNTALGTEYTMTGNVISQYESLEAAVASLIERKKVELYLAAEEEAYRQAILNRDDAERTLIDTENQMLDVNAQIQANEAEITRLYGENGKGAAANAKEITKLMQQNDQLRGTLGDLGNSYNEQKEIVAKYAYDVQQYEGNMMKALDNDYTHIQHKSYETAQAEGKAAKDASVAVSKATSEATRNWKSDMENAAANIPAGVANGIAANTWRAVNAAASMAIQATAAFNNNMGIKSPSRVMMKSAKFMVEGVAKGIEMNEGIAIESVENFADDLTNAMNPSLSYNSMISGGGIASVGSGASSEAGILNLLSKYLPELANRDVTLDGDTIVGKLAPKYNKAFGRMDTLAARGV